jgi:hypothetical protein
MFPLLRTTAPQSVDELWQAIVKSLSEMFLFGDPKSVVQISGGAWPALDRMVVNLSGAVLKVSQPPPKPQPGSSRQAGISVDQFEVIGRPIRYEQNQLQLELKARAVRFDFAPDNNGQIIALLAGARDGRVDVSIGRADLQAALLAGATAAAKAHGVAIQDVQMDLQSRGPRSLTASVRVKAKKSIVSGTVVIRGNIDVDDNLVATVSNLHCSGEGVFGTMAAAMLNPKVRSFEGRSFPLMALSLGDVHLRDLKIDPSDPIRVSAEFG